MLFNVLNKSWMVHIVNSAGAAERIFFLGGKDKKGTFYLEKGHTHGRTDTPFPGG